MQLSTLAGGLVLASAMLSTGEPRVSAADSPHVVFFLADDLGWRDVGFHGSEIETPHIDRLAKDGVRLKRFYVLPYCSPTRAALLTGRYPIRYGLQAQVVRPWAEHGLPTSERTLAEALKGTGYSTAICGKWHLGLARREFLPRQRGFDHQYGHYTGALDYFTHERMGLLDWHRGEKPLREEGYTTTLIGREAARLVEEHDPGKPLFLYVPFNSPHAPLQAPQNYINRYKHIKDKKRRIYAAMVTAMDEAIGRVVEALQKRGMREKTLILFSSDNGGMRVSDNRPLRGGKGKLYEGGVRVPAFANWPGVLKSGRVVEEPLHIVDWYPTLIKLAGGSLDQPLPIDGKDIWPVLTAGKPSPHEEILLNVNRVPPERPAAARWSGLIRGDWKVLIDRNEGRPKHELYNLADDPREQTNLAGQHPEKLKEMLGRLSRYEAQAAEPLVVGRPPQDFPRQGVWGPEIFHSTD